MRNDHAARPQPLDDELADFLDNASVAIHWVGPDGTILRANRTELELLGYDAEEYIGRPITDFHVDRPRIDALLELLAAGETVREYPARLRCKDGSIRDVLINSNVRFHESEFVHTRCFTIDVTERRRAQEALRTSEERYRRLIELLPVAVYSCDAPSGIINYFNERATEVWGRTPQVGDTDERFCGSLGMYLPDGTHLPHADRPMSVALREGRAFRGEEVIVERPDGSRVTVLVDIDPVLDDEGRVVGAVNVIHDVSALKRTEGQLREQKENLQTLLATLPVAVMIAQDPDCRRITGNPAAAELLRTAPGSNLSKSAPRGERPAHFQTMLDGHPVPPDDLPIQRAARGEVVRSEELDLCFDDGSVTRTFVWAQPLYDAGGRPRGAVASLLDITELKEAESALREAGRRKDEFLATLAHELRNPLAPIGYALEIMKLAGDDLERVENARETMHRQLRHLVRLVDDLLDVSRITRGKLELRTEPVEMGAVLDRAIEASSPLCEAAEHELTVTVPAEPVHLHADPVRLAQVFGNLLNNACKYTPRRGHIRVSIERHGSEGVLTVADSGMGIEPEALSRVFDMFTQIDGSHERVQGGVGIGLTLVKGLVEMHGGTVQAFSEGLGRGSRFVVRLPALAAESPDETDDADVGASTPEGRKVRGAIPSRRVLVVEDNLESARSLGELLAMKGHETHTVHDGAEAIARAEALRPDIVLLDIGLPKMNGYDVCRAIRRRPWGARTVVVALTGWGQEEDRRRSRDAGFDGHLVKPVEFDDLARFLRAATGEPGAATDDPG